MIISVGEILFDIFPDYKRLGGAPFNFAFHMSRLGFPVRFISRVGDDDNGREILRLIEQAGFQRQDIQIDDEHPTGYVRVTLDSRGVPEFSIVPEVAYDYITINNKIVELMKSPPALFYYGTLAQRSFAGAEAMKKLFTVKQKKTLFFYDVNLRQDCYTLPVIRDSLFFADVLKLNQEELELIGEMEKFQKDNDNDLIDHLMKKYHLKTIALTRGEDGSALFTSTEHVETKAVLREDTIDTVGAGDAFAAVLAAGILRDQPLRETAAAAAAFAADICTIAGAVPEDREFYENIKEFTENF